MLELDHLAVACTDLAEGTAWVEECLGVTLQTGGEHPRYGTHNTLLGLADGLYLEVIAKEPSAIPEDTSIWFDLDRFSGPPRLANWICRTEDLDAMRALTGPPRAMTRGDLRWQITVPDDGSLPYGGAYPTLIQWGADTPHPATSLPDSGCRLRVFKITHPDAAALEKLIDLSDERVTFAEGPLGMVASFDTPHGTRSLS